MISKTQIALAACLALVAVFFLGRLTAPEKRVEVSSARTESQVRATEKTSGTTERQTTKTTVTKFSRKTGKPVTRTTTEDTQVSQAQTAQTDTIRFDKSVFEKRVEIPAPFPKWFAGPVAVWLPSAPVGQQWSAGLLVGRHLFGPVSAAVSVTVPVHRPVSLPAIGAAITVSF